MAPPSVEMYTDGSCSPNPGLGGWGVVLISPKHDRHRKELSGYQASTTNNAMELRACIEGLKVLKTKCKVRLTTDSKYVMDAFEKGWLKKWKKNGWRNSSGEKVPNLNLWKVLMALVARHDVKWQWVRGHSGHEENDRADSLAVAARLELKRKLAKQEATRVDTGT